MPQEVLKKASEAVLNFNNDNLLDVILGAAIFTTNETIQVLTATGISDFPQVLILTQTK